MSAVQLILSPQQTNYRTSYTGTSQSCICSINWFSQNYYRTQLQYLKSLDSFFRFSHIIHVVCDKIKLLCCCCKHEWVCPDVHLSVLIFL